jgi:hypothetical protein
MRLSPIIAVVIVILAPLSAMAGEGVDAFATEAKEQNAARRAEMKDREEGVERSQEGQRQREIDHPSIVDDDDLEDDLKDDLEAGAPTH